MLQKRRCERTGVINFFADSEPLLAAGSIVQIAASQFVWRSHVDDSRVGIAEHLPVAEAHLCGALGAGPSAPLSASPLAYEPYSSRFATIMRR
jgi:hypothetical protein